MRMGNSGPLIAFDSSSPPGIVLVSRMGQEAEKALSHFVSTSPMIPPHLLELVIGGGLRFRTVVPL